MAIYKDNIKTKDGRCWYYICNKNGKQYKSKRFLTKAEAKEEESLFLLKRDNPRIKNFHLVAKEYFEYISKINKASSVQSCKFDYNKHIKPFFKDYDINNIRTEELKKWHEYMDIKELSSNFKNKVLSTLSSIFNYAIREYGLESNYATLYGRFKEKKDKPTEEKIRYITYDEFKKFISVVDDDLWHCFFSFAFYTGCRKGEIFALTWKDIDFDNAIINITKTWTRTGITSTKTNKSRKIKINKTLFKELFDYKLKQKCYNDFKESWFVFGNTNCLARTSVDRYKHKYFQLSGIHEITMHEFRHSAVTLLVNEMLKQDNNLDINKILFSLSTRFGHSPEVMLRTYAHIWEDRLQDNVVDILDKL